MGKKAKGTLLVIGAAAGYSVVKAIKGFIDYQKLKNKTVYINAETVDAQGDILVED